MCKKCFCVILIKGEALNIVSCQLAKCKKITRIYRKLLNFSSG
nr:MAG TPA: Triple gene block 3 [Caudoviricetes sp.]